MWLSGLKHTEGIKEKPEEWQHKRGHTGQGGAARSENWEQGDANPWAVSESVSALKWVVSRMWGLNTGKWAVQTGYCIEGASKGRWTQRGGGRRRRGSYHNKTVLVPPQSQEQLQPWRSSWQWLSQELNLLPTELPAGRSCSFSSPLCQINADYTTLPLLLTATLQCCCSSWQTVFGWALPPAHAVLFNGYWGRTGLVVKIHPDCIGLHAVTPVLCGFVYQWEVPKGNLIKLLYLSGCIHGNWIFSN